MRLYFVLIIAVLACGCVNAPDIEPVLGNLSQVNYDPYPYSPPHNFINSTPLLFEVPVAKSPMPYYIFNDTELNAYKYNLTIVNIEKAFDAWENATRGKVVFYRAMEKPEHGIKIHLVGDLPNNTVGEASALFFPRSNYTLIVGGNMEIETLYGGSENRVLIMHEIGHVMGFGHTEDSHSIMYPWNAYSQVITKEILDTLDGIYR